MLRWLTAGESHGPELIAIMEGLPAGVPVSLDDIRADLARRKLGYGRGARMKFEEDELTISGGVRFGATMGSPIAIRIGNTEWPRWVDVMSASPVDVASLPKGRGAPLTRPRPGHADLVVSGLEMLLHQAIEQVRIFVTGEEGGELDDEDEVIAAMRKAVRLNLEGSADLE